MIKSIIDLSKNLGFTVLAEGVETEEQFKLIKKLKCNNIQGFYFSKPLDKEKLLEFLKK